MISLIATVRNERATLPEWFASIKAQTTPPDEIILVDGASTDGTWEWLLSVANEKVRVFQVPGNIAQGRNAAITRARGDIIAVADAGCHYESTWLARLTAPLVSGQASLAATAFKPWLRHTDSVRTLVIASATVPAPREFARPWLASSRSIAFLKAIWDTVGGYPEWLPICEDVVFDLALKKQGIKEVYISEPLVEWRPRTCLTDFCRQLFNYTRGDGHAQLFLGRQLIRYGVYAGAVAAAVLALGMSQPWWWLGLGLGAVIYFKKFWQRWFIFTATKPLGIKVLGMVFVPMCVVLGDCAKMAGWPVGVGERWLGTIKFQKNNL